MKSWNEEKSEMVWMVIQFLGYETDYKSFPTYEEAKSYFEDEENFITSNRILVEVKERK